jgi:glycosyltransferase involved in cell wall biosynthesis
MMMKILLVAPHFPPRHFGGVEFYTKRLADYLRAAGDSPEVMCAERIDADAPAFDAVRDTTFGYPVHRLSFNVSTEVDAFKASYRSAAVEAWTTRLLEAVRPDVVHLHSGYLLGGAVLSAARHREIPTVVTLHDFWFVCARITLLNPDGTRCSGPDSAAKCAWCLATEQRRFRLPDAASGGRLGRVVIKALAHPHVAAVTGWSPAIRALSDRTAALRDALMHASLVLAPSRFLRDLMVQTGLPADRVVISRYGIDVPIPKPRIIPDGPGLRIGFLGQLAPHKGVDVLVEALRRLPDAPLRVRIYGDPHSHAGYAEELQRLSDGDLRITFHGAYRHEHVYDLLAALDVIVVPSVWYENAPFVIQEAQAAHVPVLASRLGGMRELVTDEHDGLLFDPGNPQDLARQLRRLLEEPSLLERLRPDGTSVRTEADEMRELSAHYQRLARHAGESDRGHQSLATAHREESTSPTMLAPLLLNQSSDR